MSAKFPDLVFVADQESLEKKRCLEPRAIERGNVHADLQFLYADL
jgi:hypothetical protein